MTGVTAIRVLTLCTLVTSSACAGGSSSRPSEPETPGAALTLADAIAAAEAEVGAGVTVEAEREDDGQREAFEVEILVDGELREVVVAASDGEVLAVRPDPEELDEATQAAARVPEGAIGLREAISIAEQASGAAAVEIEIGEAGYLVQVASEPARVVTVGFADGAVLATEPAEPEGEDGESEDGEGEAPAAEPEG